MEGDPDLSGYAEIADTEIIAELAWDGLKKSVKEGWRSQEEADQLYFEWFKKHV